MTPTTPATLIDLRPLPPRERHPRVFDTLRSLGPGESFELINDHDPLPLREQLRAQWPGRFSWDDQQRGPDVWRVRIARLAGHGDGRCCGACGGA